MDLFGVSTGFDKYTRVSNVCIWTDATPINGSRERVNGLDFTYLFINSGATYEPASCFGACNDIEECTDIEGEIIKFEMWHSDDATLSSYTTYGINQVQFTTTTG